MSRSSTSIGGLLAFLQEDDSKLRGFCLRKLLDVVDLHWPELGETIPVIEALAEDESFPSHELAAAVCSKCYFHLAEYGEALRFALTAGTNFNINSDDEYTRTMIGRCVDEYAAYRERLQNEGKAECPNIVRMVEVVEAMFDRCFCKGDHKQAVGLAIMCMRLDKLEEAIASSDEQSKLIRYVFSVAQSLIRSRTLRCKILKLLVALVQQSEVPDYVLLAQAQQVLNNPDDVAAMIEQLMRGDQNSALFAYQVCFNLVESENQAFLLSIKDHLPVLPGPVPADAPDKLVPEGPDDYHTRIQRANKILDGIVSVDLSLDFLCRQNQTDLVLLNKLKKHIGTSSSVLNNFLLVCHGYMTCGTTADAFLRDNHEWLKNATHWSRFCAVSSLGMMHKGHVRKARQVLAPYLPQPGAGQSSPYAEGGGLYALGLIHANKGGRSDGETVTYLRDALRDSGTACVQHGACLGIGLAGMATGDDPIYVQLRDTVYHDDAESSAAAALAIGLVLIGKGTSWMSNTTGECAVSELLAYAHDTKHTKIISAIGMGVSLMVYGQEEGCLPLVEQLSRDKDPLLRAAACTALAMAFVATESNIAVRRLLSVAVTDVDKDVQRMAVSCLGFVLCRVPGEVPTVVKLLVQSYNPHIRYGSCMALGLGCAGSGSAEAIALLEGLLDDSEPFVQQGALSAMAMVLMEAREGESSKAKEFREKLLQILSGKKPLLVKCGALLATGIINAGGRNVVLEMTSRGGFKKMSAIVGCMVWLHHWDWFPLMHFLSLAFNSTALVGLNVDFKMPATFTVRCNAAPSEFAYPEKLPEEQEKEEKKVEKTELSAASKPRRTKKGGSPRAIAKTPRTTLMKAPSSCSGIEGKVPVIPLAAVPILSAIPGQKPDDAMDVEESATQNEGEEKVGVVEEKPEEKKETSFFVKNPGRVIPSQLALLEVDEETSTHVPIYKGAITACSVVMLKEKSDAVRSEEAFVDFRGAVSEDAEPEAPSAFEWSPEDEDAGW